MAGPILLTGSHRSGTTWVGRVLGLSGEVAGVHEPFNPGHRLSWLREPPEQWFQYVDEQNAARYRPSIEALVARREPVALHARSVRSPRDAAQNVRELGRSLVWRVQRRRLLMKDPIAFFAAPWLAGEFGMGVVVLIRHPAAFAGSLKKLGWTFDFTNFTAQPRLMDRWLSPFAAEIEAAAANPPDIIDQAILLWRGINSVALQYGAQHRDWAVLRYEDLAADPLGRFPDLYHRLGLAWSADVANKLTALTSSTNAGEVAAKDCMTVRRDARAAMWTWHQRLDPGEIDRIRDGTDDVAADLYPPADWTR